MAHEISVTLTGTTEAVFGFGEVPWWNSAQYPATVLDRAVTFDEVFTLAFPWSAEMEQLQYADGSLSSQHGIRRSDTHVELGVHSGAYGNIQPRDLFDFCASFFEVNKVPIASAIAMRGGRVLNISARLGEINVLGSGDIHKSYLCFVNSYDGSLKAQVYKSYVQPVCMNTTVAGLSSADFKMTYKHTKNVRQRIAGHISQAQQLMLAQQATDAQVQEVLETLAKRKLTKVCYEAIMDELFGKSDSTRTKNTKSTFTDIVAHGVNATAYPDFKGTAYGVYTALTDYLDHYRPVRLTAGRAAMSETQIRAEGALIGEVADLKQSALQKILVLSNGAEAVEDRPMYSIPTLPLPEVVVTPSSEAIAIEADVDIDPTVDTGVAADTYIDLYTTAVAVNDLPGTLVEGITEEISPMVSMRHVKVPVRQLAAQKNAYTILGCACFTAEEWAAVQTKRHQEHTLS